MEKILKLTLKDAKKIYPTASKELKVILENTFGSNNLSSIITDRINSFKDIMEILEETENNAIPYKNAQTLLEKSLNAHWRGEKIAKAYNEGTILDYNNSNEYKYFIYSYLNRGTRVLSVGSWDDSVSCPAGLGFKNRTLALDALAKFPQIYKDFFMVE